MKQSIKKEISAKKANATVATYNVPAIDKAFDVLELLGDSTSGMSLTGIADALGRTKQELFRVLSCLTERGYLVRDGNQHYRLSTKMFEIGSRHASTQALIVRAMPHMERLVKRLGHSCHLNIVVQNKMLVIARVECDADIMLTVRVGATFELHLRTSGLMGLAMLSDDRRKQYWKQAGVSKKEIVTYEEEMSRYRKQRFIKTESPVVIGVEDCAASILGSGESLLGVLCVSCISRTDELPEVQDVAQEIIVCAEAIAAEFGPVEVARNETV